MHVGLAVLNTFIKLNYSYIVVAGFEDCTGPVNKIDKSFNYMLLLLSTLPEKEGMHKRQSLYKVLAKSDTKTKNTIHNTNYIHIITQDSYTNTHTVTPHKENTR